LLAALAYVLLLAIVALAVPLALNLRARVTAEVRTQAQGQADLVAATAADLLDARNRSELQTLASRAAASVRGRIIIVSATGIVLVDSAGPGTVGTSYGSRPEIAQALRGRQVQGERSSHTLGLGLLVTAVPIIRHSRTVGAVRVTESTASLGSAVRRAEIGVVLIGVIVLALGLFAGAVVAGQIGRPIGRLEQVARRVAQGDLNARAAVEGSREQRSLAVSFNEMTARITQLLDVQRQFVADASHQLRTPLTGLRLRLEEAKALHPSPDADAELDAAMAELDRLTHTVNELLVLSRAGERRLTATAIDLDDLADVACERWHAAAARLGVALVRQRIGGALAPARAARADVERALDVLIENAINYAPPASTVELVTAPARIEVRDRGPGVGPDEREAVFQRFRRGRAGLRGRPGSGLGLAIARELAQGWGGEVTLEEREGGGAIAVLSLPGQEPAPSPLPALNLEAGSVA
jgi:two-component system, OmpR family, sensor kinase